MVAVFNFSDTRALVSLFVTGPCHLDLPLALRLCFSTFLADERQQATIIESMKSSTSAHKRSPHLYYDALARPTGRLELTECRCLSFRGGGVGRETYTSPLVFSIQ